MEHTREAIERQDELPAAAVAEAVHAINNPLCAIIGLLEFLVADAEPGTRSSERLVLVRSSALEIKEIVADLHERSQGWEQQP